MTNPVKQEEYIGEVLSDGHLSLPDAVRQRLSLVPASIVKVYITVENMEKECTANAWTLVRSMGRAAATGKLKNSAEEHDRYLYKKASK
jgi:hypothetical protein